MRFRRRCEVVTRRVEKMTGEMKGAAGYCKFPGGRKFEVVLSAKLTHDEMIRTVAHEVTHILIDLLQKDKLITANLPGGKEEELCNLAGEITHYLQKRHTFQE